jgi:hypothetical protein
MEVGEQPLDISKMSINAVMDLTDDELTLIIQHGYWDLYGTMIGILDTRDHLAAIRAGHWVPGLPSRAPKSREDLSTLGL